MNPVILTLLVTAQAELQQALMSHITGEDDDATTMTKFASTLGKLDDAVGIVGDTIAEQPVSLAR